VRPLVILRPEPGASATAERAKALGLTPIVHPLSRTVPVAWTMPAGPFDAVLLTSANAVRHGGRLPALPAHVVGEATARVARAAGVDVVTVGSGGIDALLAELPGELRLLHLAGEERIAPTTPCQVITAVTVYRAEPLPDPPSGLFFGAVVSVHSPASGRRLASLALDRQFTSVAAISPAVAAACGSGWDSVSAAETPSDSALLSLAVKLCKDPAS